MTIVVVNSFVRDPPSPRPMWLRVGLEVLWGPEQPSQSKEDLDVLAYLDAQS